MQIAELASYLDDAQKASPWLANFGVGDAQRAHQNLLGIAEAGVTLDLLAAICDQLLEHLPSTSDPDRALNNLERFVSAARNPLTLGSLFERDPEALPILLQMFSTSQHLSDLLVQDPESYDLLRLTEGEPIAREVLVEEICSEVAALQDRDSIMKALRRYKRRETLRISYGDIIGGQRIDIVTRQISWLADAICEAALLAARRKVDDRRGQPLTPEGRRSRFVVLALGKLGGEELNYSSDIDLMFLYEAEGQTSGSRSVDNHEYFERLCRELVKLLTETTDLGSPYRVDLRLRPDGKSGPIAISREAALNYYDTMGRTWERQAFVKARPIAGDLDFGREFLGDLEPWIYRRYLSRADITGIKALKRRIEQRATRENGAYHNVKTGRGGIRDIEFVIQFLQLLNGGDLSQIRTHNTLEAINRLEVVGCLTLQERNILEENYAALRKIEHRLQIMFDLQTHSLPADEEELRKLALRAGYESTDGATALEAFRIDYREKTDLNRQILDHLLHDAFGEKSETEPEVDLVLDPEPPRHVIENVLGKHGFADVHEAYKNLMALSVEKIRFLSTRRCRHFLAAIAPNLLRAVAGTPDPDATLVALNKVSDSLGGKGVLWELFSSSEAALDLYVRLCASSPYLSGILTSNPGMIDELLDSLLLDKLPSLKTYEDILTDLLRGAEDIDPILHGFKASQHLNVGVRDILGKEDIKNTHRALSDIAEVCLRRIAHVEYLKLAQRLGTPTLESGERCELIILALGKLGGREPNYHSDLDIVFLYEADGQTVPERKGKSGTTNQHFFSQLGQRIIKIATQMGPHGRLYEVDPRLRPTGRSGALAVPLDEFARYFAETAQLWERQALCKGRIIVGSPGVKEQAEAMLRRAIVEPPWKPEFAASIHDMRRRLEETATTRNLKRGAGGTVDIEFTVQMLQLKHAKDSPEVLTPGTLDAIEALESVGGLSSDHAEYFARSYRFLRNIEAHLRLMNTTARHDLPEEEGELKKLAYLLGDRTPEQIRQECEEYTAENRRRFEEIFGGA